MKKEHIYILSAFPMKMEIDHFAPCVYKIGNAIQNL